jgi:RNA polymerase sigma factor (sigma-70 family)
MVVQASTTDPENLDVKAATRGTGSDRAKSRRRETRSDQGPNYFFCEEFLDETRAEEILAEPQPPDTPNRVERGTGAPAFYSQIGSVPLLDKAAEQQYFRKYNYLKYLAARRASIPNASTRSRNRQPTSLHQAADEVRNRIVEANLRLVVSLAKDYGSSTPGEIDELICIGNTALIRAVELFDFRRGLRFSTYAYQAVSRSMITSFTRGKRRSSRIKLYGDEVPDTVETRDGTPFTLACLQESKESARMLIDQLEARDRRIVMSRFGIGHNHNGASFSKIAKEIGISTTRTVQLFHRSMEKIRRLAVTRGIIESETAA